MNSSEDFKTQDLSLVAGGLLFRLLRRSHLTGDALELLLHRILVISLITWLPLLVLSALEGQALGGSAAVAFLLDWETHVRFLVVLPLFFIAETVNHWGMRLVAKQFHDRNLIPESALPRFDRALSSALRLRNSVLAEVLVIGFVYAVGINLLWRQQTALQITTWYGASTAGGLKLSLTGMWFLFVSLPLFQFLQVRWYFRLFIWMRFLWQVSRIDLRLVPTHPDRAGGLGFLSNTAHYFMPLVAAHGALLSGWIANRIFHLGAALPDFKIEIGIFVIVMQVLVLGPLLFFAPGLASAKRKGRREYGTLAEHYVQEFDTKWLRGAAPANESLVGSADIQSLADLSNSYEVVRSMRIAPVTRDAIVSVAAMTLVPVAPLLLTMMPLEQLLKKLLAILL